MSSPDRIYVPIIDDTPSISLTDVYLESEHTNLKNMLSEWDQEAVTKHQIAQVGQPTDFGNGLRYDKVTLFHGSDTAGLTKLKPAEDHTFGYGLYTTPVPRKAAGYALTHSRGQEGEQPTVYEVEAEDVTFFDARNVKNRDDMLVEFADELERELPSRLSDAGADWIRRWIAQKTIPNLISSMRARNFSAVHGVGKISHVDQELTHFLKEQGYDGLIIGEMEHLVGPHESYVVFEPAALTITNEVSIHWFVEQGVKAANMDTASYQKQQKELHL